MCLVPCDGDACADGFACLDRVCLPDAVAALTLDAGNTPNASVDPPPLTLCASDPVVWRSLTVDDQRGYDALAGCERVDGDLTITVLNEADLGPLRSLRVVTGLLTIQDAPGMVVRSTLAGLENIEHVGGLVLKVRLSSLGTFGQLRSIGPAVYGAYQRGALVLQTGRLSNLIGLSSLEEVDAIVIEGEPLTSLTGLGSARVRALSISSAPNITDLSGLEAVTGLEELALTVNGKLENLSGLSASTALTTFVATSNASLTSLDGLGIAAEMDLLSLVDAPLIDMTALAPLTSATEMNLSLLSIDDLDALANLRNASTLTISSNRSLAQVDALAGLLSLSSFDVVANPALLRLPAIPGVSRELSASIEANPLLAEGPSFPALTEAIAISIIGNPLLTRVDGFSALERVSRLVIARNASLLELELAALADVRSRLEIRSNGALPSMEVAALRELAVTGEAYISTADAPALLDPCPFLFDDVCDETSGDCAVGTDDDCPRTGAP